MLRGGLLVCVVLLVARLPLAWAQDDAAPLQPASYTSYIIQSGDTLISIAEQFRASIEELRALNAIAADGGIVAGHALLIPAADDQRLDVYEVRAGDTLFAIARRFNTTVGILLSLNQLGDADEIAAGQRLLAPALDEGSYEVHVVGAHDTLPSIARCFFTTVDVLRSLNGLAAGAAPVEGQRLLAPRHDGNRCEPYVARAGDTLASIAESFQTSVESLLALNSLVDANDIESGQSILVPRAADARFAAHIARPGDTLFDIARLYNTTVAQLSRLNGIDGGFALHAGRRVIVPKVDETILEPYIVRTGDSLYSIARRFDTEVDVLQALNRLADARDIRIGQRLLAPKLRLAIHRIQAGDTLEGIAAQYETTVALLQSLNGIADPSLIVLDQAILAPVPKALVVKPGFGFGIQVFIDRDAAVELAALAKRLGAGWVKLDVSWAALEPARKAYSYSALDAMIAALSLADLKILLNVYDAPAWSRANYLQDLNSQFREYTGPPEDYRDFAAFLANLVTRYAGLVHAYEIWKSPNLVKFWTVPVYTRARERQDDGDFGIPDEIALSAAAYAPLLQVAYETIKVHDSEALVIAAGLAPAGFGDNYNAIDTVSYLNEMLEAGAARYSDAIGAIFSASAVPPTFACCAKPPGVDTHYESFLQYFGDLLAFFDETMKAHGVELPLVVTQVGWGTTAGANLAQAATGFEWLTYTSEDEQALYVKQAHRLAQRLDYIDSMFLYNLNGCAVGDEEACFFSLVDADGRMRPAFEAYRAVPKSADAS